MEAKTTLLLTFILLMTSFEPVLQPTPTAVKKATERPTSTSETSTATSPPTISPTPTPTRSASITEMENTVEARVSVLDEYAPASTGLLVSTGGAVRTGENVRTKLDLLPESTIILVAPSTIFSIPELNEQGNEPIRFLELFIGRSTLSFREANST